MERDSLFGEPIVWTGRPTVVTTPPLYRVAALVLFTAAAIATASAVLVGTVLRVDPAGLLMFGAWCSTIGLAAWRGPAFWRRELVFTVTDRHIVVRRGRLRRTIERRAISFARIHWDPRHPGCGDLELVRAVPTGALRRRLSILLCGLTAPDRVWAIIRGVPPVPAGGDGTRPVAQRLDEGERVLWSARPSTSWRAWLPHSAREIGTFLLGVAMLAALVRTAAHAVPILQKVMAGGMPARSLGFVSLVVALALTVLLLACASLGTLFVSLVRPARLAERTRYLVTNRRVLIQRGEQELHLDRTRIVEVIETPAQDGLRNVFLVLDGPRARALAPSGAFGEKSGRGLQPVLRLVHDAEVVMRILRAPCDPLLDAA